MLQATIMVNSKTHQLKAVPLEDANTKSYEINNENSNKNGMNGHTRDNEDKTSENYVPKSYRSQTKLGLLLTHWLDKYLGIRFLQPIKWQNTIAISALHLYFLYMVLRNPWNVVKWQTAVCGESITDFYCQFIN